MSPRVPSGGGEGQHEQDMGDGRDARSGIALIAAERTRQVESEGWSASHDDSHSQGQMARLAALYAVPPDKRGDRIFGILWPSQWVINWWKPSPEDRVRELVKAGALCAAEIDRVIRASTTPPEGGSKPSLGSDHRAVVSEEAGGGLIARLRETLEWCVDWEDGQFAPAHTVDGWTVEMHGLIMGLLTDLPEAIASLASATTKAGLTESDPGGDKGSLSVEVGVCCVICGKDLTPTSEQLIALARFGNPLRREPCLLTENGLHRVDEGDFDRFVSTTTRPEAAPSSPPELPDEAEATADDEVAPLVDRVAPVITVASGGGSLPDTATQDDSGIISMHLQEQSVSYTGVSEASKVGRDGGDA